MMNKVTVKAASTAYADYEAYKADASKVTVTYGSGEKKVNLVEKGLVEITYPDEIAIGKNNVITVTAKEGSGFYGSKSVEFTVTGEKITAKNIKITVSGNSFDYTGKEVRYGENGIDPIIVTKTTVSGNEIVPVAELEEGKDYKLVYKNNINQGTATVSVVGINAYTGKKDIKFTIKKEELNWLAALTELLDNLF